MMIDDPSLDYAALNSTRKNLSKAIIGPAVNNGLVDRFLKRHRASVRAITTTKVHDPKIFVPTATEFQRAVALATTGVSASLIANGDEIPKYDGPGKLTRTIGITGADTHSASQVSDHDRRHTVMLLVIGSGEKACILSIFVGPNTKITKYGAEETFSTRRRVEEAKGGLDPVVVGNALLKASGYSEKEDDSDRTYDDSQGEDNEEADTDSSVIVNEATSKDNAVKACAVLVEEIITQLRRRRQIILWTAEDLKAISASLEASQAALSDLSLEIATAIVEKRQGIAANGLRSAEKRLANAKRAVEVHSKSRGRGRPTARPKTLEEKKKEVQEAEEALAKKQHADLPLQISTSVVRAFMRTEEVRGKVEEVIKNSINAETEAMTRRLSTMNDTTLASKLVVRPSAKDPTHVFHATQTNSYMTSNLMKEWIENVVIPWRLYAIERDKLAPTTPMVLLLDRFSGHLHPEVLQICREAEIRIVLVPAGYTDKLQPLDAAANKPFKQAAQLIRWQGLMFDNDFTIKSSKDADCIHLRIESAALSTVTPDCIVNGFRRCFLEDPEVILNGSRPSEEGSEMEE